MNKLSENLQAIHELKKTLIPELFRALPNFHSLSLMETSGSFFIQTINNHYLPSRITNRSDLFLKDSYRQEWIDSDEAKAWLIEARISFEELCLIATTLQLAYDLSELKVTEVKRKNFLPEEV